MKHLIIEIYSDKTYLYDSEKTCYQLLINLALLSNSKIVGYIHKKFEPIGFTGILLLAESHISIHVFPEYNYIAIDLFTCKKVENFNSVIKFLNNLFKNDNIYYNSIKRGVYIDYRRK